MIDAVSVSVPQLVVALATFISSFATMIYLDWLLTISLVLVAPIVSFAVSNFQRLIAASTHRAQQRIADLTANLIRNSAGPARRQVVWARAVRSRSLPKRNDDFFGAYMKLTQFIQTQPLVVSTIMVAAVVAIMWLSVREVLVGRLDTGQGLHVLGAAGESDEPDESRRGLLRRHQQGDRWRGASLRTAGSSRRGTRSAGRRCTAGGARAHRIRRRDVPLQARGTAGAYATSMPPSRLARSSRWSGPSGAGKTTIVNLVPRFYQPQEGAVLIDGVDIARVRLSDLRAAIAIVPQDVQLFRTSILENIRYGTARRDRRRSARRGARCERRRVRSELSGRVRDGSRGAGRSAFRRRAPTHRDCARRASRSADP